MARFLHAMLFLSLVILHMATVTPASSLPNTVRHDDDDGHGPIFKPPVVKRFAFRCDKSTGLKKFALCKVCVRKCRRNFGTKKVVVVKRSGDDDDGDESDRVVVVRTGDDDDDGDDEGGKKLITKIVLKCISAKCRKCRNGCRRRFGKKMLISRKRGGLRKGGDDDDNGDED